jgi:S1-C subfamily serine protease
MKLFKSVLKYITLGVVFGLWFGAFLVPSPEYVPDYKEIRSSSYTISEKRAVHLSLDSVVRIFSISDDSIGLSSLTGTYFEHDGVYYVLTSAHGILGDCSRVMIIHMEEQVSCEKITIIDRTTDYAVIKTQEMKTRKPLNLRKSLPNIKNSYKLLDKVYYTGYPNSIGPTTWTGTIAGTSGDYLILQSYAWSGSSGSGVFDERGKLIGIVMALDVGKTAMGTQVLENFVIVVPIWRIDWQKAFTE